MLIKGLILVGSGHKKDELYKGPLDKRLKDIHLGTLTSGSGLCLDDIDDVIKGVNHKHQREQWSAVENMIRTAPDTLTFGETETVDGETETVDALKEALLKRIYLQKSASRRLADMCQEVGCEIIVVGNYCSAYKVCGVRWY